MASNLQPEKRTDKNGHAVTRHVKEPQAAPGARGLAGVRPPAPARAGYRRGYAVFDFGAEPAEGYEAPTRTTTRSDGRDTYVGSKYGPDSPRRGTEIAKAVREDIKEAVEAGWLPAGLKYSVSSKKAVRVQDVHVAVTGLPDEMIHAPEPNEYGKIELAPFAAELASRLDLLVEAYNKRSSGSLGEQPYRLYYSGVELKDAAVLSYEAEEAERRRLAREERVQEGLSED